MVKCTVFIAGQNTFSFYNALFLTAAAGSLANTLNKLNFKVDSKNYMIFQSL